ncbi:MAG: S8 family serine peptidase, partial [Pseudobdellovibrionaceae bacterium]
HIINISQGTSKKTEWLPLKTAMKKHPEILFIVSAGNESENIDEQPFYPSDFGLSNMLVVTSINKYGQLSEFTNFGPQHVHFAALGENVSAALAGGGEWTVNGSSFAAPVVTNIAAKLLRENPTLTTQKLRSLLIQKAQPTAELKNKVKYGVLGME